MEFLRQDINRYGARSDGHRSCSINMLLYLKLTKDSDEEKELENNVLGRHKMLKPIRQIKERKPPFRAARQYIFRDTISKLKSNTLPETEDLFKKREPTNINAQQEIGYLQNRLSELRKQQKVIGSLLKQLSSFCLKRHATSDCFSPRITGVKARQTKNEIRAYGTVEDILFKEESDARKVDSLHSIENIEPDISIIYPNTIEYIPKIQFNKSYQIDKSAKRIPATRVETVLRKKIFTSDVLDKMSTKISSKIMPDQVSKLDKLKLITVLLKFIPKGSRDALLYNVLEKLLDNEYRAFKDFYKIATIVSLKTHHRFPQDCFRWISKFRENLICEENLLDVLFTFDNDCKQRTITRWKMKAVATSFPEFRLKSLPQTISRCMLKEDVNCSSKLSKKTEMPLTYVDDGQIMKTRRNLTSMFAMFCLLKSTESIYESLLACTSMLIALALNLVNANKKCQKAIQLRMKLKKKVDDCHYPEKPGYKEKNLKSMKNLLNFHSLKPTHTDLWVCPQTKRSIEPLLSRYLTDLRPTREETMSYELLRLCTMHDLPNPNGISFMRLAQAGFFYTGNGNEVVCFSCGMKKNNWSGTDDPLEIHREMSPNCGFFDVGRSTNIPVRYAEDIASDRYLGDRNDLEVDRESEMEKLNSTAQRLTTENNLCIGENQSDVVYDSCLPGRAITQKNLCIGENHSDMVYDSCLPGRATNSAPLKPHSRAATNDPLMLESLQHEARYPAYNTFSDRLCTFANWTKKQIPRDLAHCGLFHTGRLDCVRCFHCGIGLKNWDPDDNPWIEHARWSSKCKYLISIKGEEFIKLVIEKAKDVEKPREVSHSTGSSDSGYSSKNSATGSGKEPLAEKPTKAPAETSVKHSISNSQSIDHMKSEKNESGYNSESTTVKECDSEKLKKEIKQMTDQTVCKVCLDSKVETVFLPCGHLVCCTKCSQSLKKCPICRKRIKERLRAHVGV